MYKSETVRKANPIIFTKKLNDNSKIIPLNETKNTLGQVRFFPPATQEWFNSIYAYNSTYIKNITIADKTLSTLIKSYFNLYFSKKLLYSKRILTRFRRLAVNRVFISKAEVKHTSNKVIITLYVYNEERRALVNRLKRLEVLLFPSKLLSLKMSLKEKLNITKTVRENISLENLLKKIQENVSKEIILETNIMQTINKYKLRNQKLLVIETLKKNEKNISYILGAYEKNSAFFKQYDYLQDKYLNKILLEKEIITIAYYKLLLSLNKSKFEDKFIFKLRPLLEKIYNKKVEFNVINLKAIYLNSDIFTQAVSLKLRNRDNRLLKVLRYFLYTVKLPKVNILKERFAHIDIKNLWTNRVKNLKLNTVYSKINKDKISQIMAYLFNKSNFLKKSEIKELDKINNNNEAFKSVNLMNFVLDSLKYKNMAGIRLEAKGRLTRRLTASRSVFKIKWKGSLKNIDSSYRGLSSVILRGHIKSNVQSSIINSKTRNGSFGLKGWVSGK